MSQLYQKNEETLLFIKGATETLLSLSTQIQENGLLREILDEDKTRITKAMTTFASQGYRILSLGYRIIDSNLISMVGSDKDDVREIFEQDLIYIGFVVIYDPPRPDAYIGIQECRSAQIKTIMITGDNLITATAIATDLDIYRKEEDLAVEGNSIEILSNDDFQRVSVYARVSPEHKQIIVGRYQEMGKIVAMSGDGVNDALALSMADCGVAMGIQGTEVAKEAADMVITDDSFSTIVTGIREGRGLFEKIRTIIYFFVCVSVMEAIILFTSTLNPNNPFFQMWDFHQLNLLYITAHMFPSLGFTFGSYSKTIMNEPPRDSAEILTKNIMKIMLVQAVLMGLAIVISYYFSSFGFIKLNDVNAIYGPYHGINEILPLETQIKARTMAFVVLFLLESLLMPLQIRRLNDPLKKSLKDLDYWKEFLYYIPSMLILIIAIYSIPFQTFMGEKIGWNINLMYLSLSDWLICIGLSIPAFIVFELVRQYYWKKSVYF
jgi:Ca2+-transporting ATPase